MAADTRRKAKSRQTSEMKDVHPIRKGRPKGLLNKLGRTAKEAIALAADELGGYPRLVEWARADKVNERISWGTIYPKLLPLQLSGEDGQPLGVVFNTIYETKERI